MSGIDREALGAEREFLLRSLDDLEEERAAGNVDSGTYRELHDDYTARAAAVIRSLEAGTDLTPPEAPRTSTLRQVLTASGLVVFALVAAVALSHAVGQRRPGQTITGNSQASGSPTGATGADAGAVLAAAVKRQPNSYAARIAYARYLLTAADLPNAVRQFGAAARLEPSQPEPPTYAAWAGALLSQQVSGADGGDDLLAASHGRIDEVIKDHPKYPDAYVFRGLILFNFEGKARDAVPSFQKFLLLTDETNPLRPQVLEVLARAEKAAD